LLLNTTGKIRCSTCNHVGTFDLIEDIECDWGTHDVIQCNSCQELFSIDKQCQAFQDALILSACNDDLMTDKEKYEYIKNPHC